MYFPSLRISNSQLPCGVSPHVCTDMNGHDVNPALLKSWSLWSAYRHFCGFAKSISIQLVWAEWHTEINIRKAYIAYQEKVHFLSLPVSSCYTPFPCLPWREQSDSGARRRCQVDLNDAPSLGRQCDSGLDVLQIIDSPTVFDIQLQNDMRVVRNGPAVGFAWAEGKEHTFHQSFIHWIPHLEHVRDATWDYCYS